MIRRMLAMVALILTTGITVVAFWPTGSTHSAPIILPTYSPTPVATLPACTHEDGSGQALCAWDASEQGNGLGTDVVAGDCSVGTVGTVEASRACLKLWAMGARTTYMNNSASSHIENGSVLVSDCLDIEFQASHDKSIREQLNNDGWNLTECFKAHME